MILSPSPSSIFCVLLLCLPLAIIFTATTPTAVSPFTDPHRHSLASFLLNHHKPKKPISRITPPPPPSPPPPRPPPPKDDDLLLNAASKVSAKPSRPKKIAFLFLTNGPLPFAPLWELFFNQTRRKHKKKKLFNIYIHADPTSTYDPPFSGVFARRVIHSKPTQRHSPTLIAAATRLLANALLDDPSNAVFALLSPSCIPLHSFDFTYRTLTGSSKSFIEILANETGAYERWAARGERAMLPEVNFEDFRIGSQFWAMTRKHAKIVVGDRVIWPKFNLTCVWTDTCFPDEHYFPTLIEMRDPGGSVSATLTHVSWLGGVDGHPRMRNASEVGPDLIRRLRKRRPRYGYEEINGSDSSVMMRRNDPFLFARKFSPDSIKPLMRIARKIILKDY